MSKKALPHSSPNFTTNDVAEHFGVSVRTVRRWVADGYLKPVRVGPRLIRFRPEDIEALESRAGGVR